MSHRHPSLRIFLMWWARNSWWYPKFAFRRNEIVFGVQETLTNIIIWFVGVCGGIWVFGLWFLTIHFSGLGASRGRWGPPIKSQPSIRATSNRYGELCHCHILDAKYMWFTNHWASGRSRLFVIVAITNYFLNPPIKWAMKEEVCECASARSRATTTSLKKCLVWPPKKYNLSRGL